MTRSGAGLLLVLLLLPACGGGGGSNGQTQTPERGTLPPGTAQYLHTDVTTSTWDAGDLQYWLFEPASPTPASAPLIVFLHGWSVMDPATYRGFVDHIVKRGNVVVFPRYQASVLTPPASFTGNAITAIQNAITRLGSGGHVAPELDKAAVLGHSFGGVLSANVAALAAPNGLPPFLAILVMMPGTLGFGVYEDYAQIPAGTLLVSVAGEDDTFVGDTDAKRIFNESTSLPLADRDYVIMRSDLTHAPALTADHSAPNALSEAAADALDWRGFWKWFDGLTCAAFYGTFRDHALGDTIAQKDMGTWPDAVPITQPTVTDTP